MIENSYPKWDLMTGFREARRVRSDSRTVNAMREQGPETWRGARAFLASRRAARERKQVERQGEGGGR